LTDLFLPGLAADDGLLAVGMVVSVMVHRKWADDGEMKLRSPSASSDAIWTQMTILFL
jgi:hypothetical protein